MTAAAAATQTLAMSFTIRPERSDDPDEVAAIAAVNAAAFERPAHGALPAALRATPHYRPRWCFVATEASGAVVGHVMVGTAFLDLDADGEGRRREIPNLSPLAVVPHRQRQGVGRALVEAVIAAVDADGEPFVVLEGSPAYYGRLGFEDAREHGVTLPLPDWAPREAGQLYPLTGYRRLPGRVVYPPSVQAAFDAVDD